MADELIDWTERARLLVQAVRDVQPVGHPRPNSTGSSRHHVLFESYVKRLREHKRVSEAWINALIDSEEEETGDRDQAIANVLERRPIGAVSHPFVTGTVRKYWLACVSLNGEVQRADQVAPEEFILLWLMQRGHVDLAELLAGYPFWPVGMDADGRWV
jgi:hypothetical protein